MDRPTASIMTGHEDTRPETPEHRSTVWTLAVTLCVMATGMAYGIWWPGVVRHDPSYWTTPGDLWETVRTAHWIGWGAFSFVYSSHTGLLTLPGMPLVLTPVVMLTDALGLVEVAPGFLGAPHPSSWLVIGPVTLAFSAVALFALDALARHLRIARSRRRWLTLAEGATIWAAVAYWGHPEDVVALGLATYGLVALLRGRNGAAGWLLGAAIGFQLYVIVLVPLFVGIVGLRKAGALLARAAVIPGFLAVVVLVPDFRHSFTILWKQPMWLGNHPTPWSLVAPKVGRGLVAGGPGHIVAIIVACAVGVLASRRRSDARMLVWLAMVALAARCVFESVMIPYFVMPVVALGLIAVASRGRLRWLCACATGVGLTVMVHMQLAAWSYWLLMTGLVAVFLGLAAPRLMASPTATAASTASAPDGSESSAALEATQVGVGTS
jgi:hypothetical protein